MDFDTGMFVRSIYELYSRKNFSKLAQMSNRMLDITDPDRPKAMLTKKERRGLINDWSGMSRQERSYHQREIVKRVKHSLLDFSLLYENLPENRRKEIFEVGDNPTDEEANQLLDGLIDTIAFFYLSLNGESDEKGAYYRPLGRPFSSVLRPGVAKAERRRATRPHWHSVVNVNFSVETSEIAETDVDRIIEKIAEGNATELSGGEARSLIELADKSETHSSAFMEGWDDLGQQIQERREKRDDIRTQEDWDEIAERSDNE